MNGRIYDPLIGRFMSADPFIQAPYNLQNFNRYGYVLNNPLRFFDPSGYFYGDTRDYDSDGNTTYSGNSYTDSGGSSSDGQSMGTLDTVTVTAERDDGFDQRSDSGSDWSSYQVAGLVLPPPPAPPPAIPAQAPNYWNPRLERPVVNPVRVPQMPRPATVVPSITILEHLFGLRAKVLDAMLSVVPEKQEGKLSVPDGKFWKDKGIDPEEVKNYDPTRNLAKDQKGNVWSVDRKGSGNPQWEGTIDSLSNK